MFFETRPVSRKRAARYSGDPAWRGKFTKKGPAGFLFIFESVVRNEPDKDAGPRFAVTDLVGDGQALLACTRLVVRRLS